MPVPPVPVPPVPRMMTLRRSVLRQALGAAVRAVAPHAGFGVTQQHARQCGCGDRLRTATVPLGNAACGSRAVPRERAGSHGDSGAAEGSLFPPWFSSKAPGEVTLQTIPYSYLGLRATEWSRGSRAGQWHRGPCQRRDLAVPPPSCLAGEEAAAPTSASAGEWLRNSPAREALQVHGPSSCSPQEDDAKRRREAGMEHCSARA